MPYFRPILMTACTTVFGLIPLAVGTSGVFELRYFPLARTVMGGLISLTTSYSMTWQSGSSACGS
jgi:multidrug efflux pump subunit AcrB